MDKNRINELRKSSFNSGKQEGFLSGIMLGLGLSSAAFIAGVQIFFI